MLHHWNLKGLFFSTAQYNVEVQSSVLTASRFGLDKSCKRFVLSSPIQNLSDAVVDIVIVIVVPPLRIRNFTLVNVAMVQLGDTCNMVY